MRRRHLQGPTRVPARGRRARAPSALVLIVAVGMTGAALGQGALAASPLFADETPLELTIEGPFRELGRDGDERPERPGRIRVRNAAGDEIVLDVEIRIRGNSRLAICSSPPLRLDFQRSQLEGTVFEGQNRLKLVTLCRPQSAYRDYLAQEFQIYKIFNALTDRSFRVRWATVEYVESDPRRENAFVEPAFLVEEDWEVAARHGLEVLEAERLGVDDLEPRHAALFGLFQYAIGNTDWSALEGPGDDICCHNGNVVGSLAGGAIVLPYDFDQAGLINASYAQPSERLKIRSVTQRIYRGFCAANGELEWARGRFDAERGAIVAILSSAEVGERAARRAVQFIERFYEIIDDPERFAEEIVDECRG
jgi:hypothetical protein